MIKEKLTNAEIVTLIQEEEKVIKILNDKFLICHGEQEKTYQIIDQLKLDLFEFDCEINNIRKNIFSEKRKLNKYRQMLPYYR